MPRVLIVEDNELNRDMLSRRLTKRGYDVVLAVDGAHGLVMARESAPDLILMDMSLPLIDGWEATRLLKGDPRTGAIPIIALTAHAMAGDEAKARAAGCDDFDTKPVELPRLLGKIERWLAHRAAPVEPEPLVLDARRESLPELLAYVDAASSALPEEVGFAVRLAAEEVCMNVISHAYPPGEPGPLALSLVHDDAAATITVEDRGAVFDPATLAAPDLQAPAEEREPGGLGWHLVYQVMDEVRHTGLPGGGNRVVLIKHLPSPLPDPEL